MANLYKTIGNTAAAVVSLLAVGTLCWWQRTPGPLNAPRPQDEAEIMTACLERHYAMGRTASGFFRQVWNGKYQTNVTTTTFINSITLTNGASSPTNHYFLGNSASNCYYDIPPAGSYVVTMYHSGGALSFGWLNSGGMISADYSGSGYLLTDSTECANFIQWFSESLGAELLPLNGFFYDDPAIWGSYDYSYSLTNIYSTNLVRLYDIETNTISFFPNAPYRYASSIRAAFIGHNLANYFAGWTGNQQINFDQWFIQGVGVNSFAAPQETAVYSESYDILSPNNTSVGWIIPEDSFMDSGDTSWFGSSVHSNVFSCPPNYWRKWDVSLDSIYGESWEEFADKWQPRQKFVWTNYVSKELSSYRTSGTYQTSVVHTQIVGSVTNITTGTVYTVSNFLVYASVNTYAKSGADPSECIAMMLPFERDTPNIERVDANIYAGTYGSPAGRYHPAFWSTNAYRDMGRAISLLQWARDYRQHTENVYWMIKYTNGVLQESSSVTGFGLAYPHIETYLYERQFPSPITNSWAWGTTVKWDFTNTTSFNLDSILFQPTTILSSNVDDYGQGPQKIDFVGTNSSGSSGWWPVDPDELMSLLDDHARTATTDTTGKYFHAEIPYDCYHFQFSAITNYLDHAPAR